MRATKLSTTQLFILCWAEDAKTRGLGKLYIRARVPLSMSEFGDAPPGVDFVSARWLIKRGFLTEPKNSFLEITDAGLAALEAWKRERGEWRAKAGLHGFFVGVAPGASR